MQRARCARSMDLRIILVIVATPFDFSARLSHLLFIGSSYGANDIQPLQPTQEFFENTLAVQWAKLDPTRPVWVEDESNNVGSVSLRKYACLL